MAVSAIDVGNEPEEQGAREHKQSARNNATPNAMQKPADIDGELLGLGARQEHTVIQRVQETIITDPAPALDQLTVHEGDLPCRAAEAQKPDFYPNGKGFPK